MSHSHAHWHGQPAAAAVASRTTRQAALFLSPSALAMLPPHAASPPPPTRLMQTLGERKTAPDVMFWLAAEGFRCPPSLPF